MVITHHNSGSKAWSRNGRLVTLELYDDYFMEHCALSGGIQIQRYRACVRRDLNRRFNLAILKTKFCVFKVGSIKIIRLKLRIINREKFEGTHQNF